MTSPDHERTHADHRAGRGPRLPRFSWGTLRGWKVGTPLVFALSGALFLISAQSSQGNDLRPGRVTTMASLVRNESNNVEQLQAEARALTEEVDRLSAAVDDETVQKARAEARNQRPAAGLTEVSGTGLQVVLSDSPREVRSTSDRDEDL